MRIVLVISNKALGSVAKTPRRWFCNIYKSSLLFPLLITVCVLSRVEGEFVDVRVVFLPSEKRY